VTDFPSGLFLLDKPAGPTSFACVQAVKRRLGAARAGHCGTLDPSARGLLLILVGQATREQDSFLGLVKEYRFCGEFGVKSATADLEGPVTERRPWDHVMQEALERTLAGFVGPQQQTPPLYSALKYKGKPYYEYARKGQDVPRVPRPVLISSLSLFSFRPPYWEGRVVCSRGTYIRTLVEDIAARLGTCARLVELNRDRIGPYRRDQALTWQELHAVDAESLRDVLLPVVPQGVPIHA